MEDIKDIEVTKCKVNIMNIMVKSFKYLLMGIAIVITTSFLPHTKLPQNEVLILAVTTSCMYAILDIYTHDAD